jgi:acyl-CoA thioester hydrolase
MSRHTYECHVRFSDVDVYGHVNNVKYFEYYQEARIEFIRTLVPDDGAMSLFEASSTERQVVARIDVDYRRPILFRPEPYLVETWVTRIGTSSYDLACRIVDAPGDQGTVYSTAEVRLVAFDVASQRSRPLGDLVRQRLVEALEPAADPARPHA